MTDQQQHLKSAIQQQGELLNEIQTLQNQVAAKRELAVKAQGIIEYLQQVGVTLPEEEEAPAEAPETATPEVESE